MKIKVNTIGAGIFSHLTIAIQNIESNIEDVDSINSVYIEPSVTSHIHKLIDQNPFNFVLDQTADRIDRVLDCERFRAYTNHSTIPISQLNRLRKICDKIKIKSDLLDRVDKKITDETCGIHVRTTDMFHYHPEHSSNKQITTDHFINKTFEIVKDVKNPIFVASDNKISILKFKEKFNIISNECINRSEYEDDKDYGVMMINSLGKKYFWEDSFLEMISLSKCGYMIYGVSNLNNAAFMFSSSLKNTYKIVI